MMNDNSIVSIVVWMGIITILGCVLFCALSPLAPDKWIYPDEVLNTFEACDWCQSEECSKYYNHCPQCCGGMTCDACVGRYQKHFNLTQETFPCYCWGCDEFAPSKLEWFFMEHF